VKQFEIFVNLIETNGSLIYCNEDSELQKVAANSGLSNNIEKIPYSIPKHRIENGITYIKESEKEIPLQIFGNHNLMNLNGARLVCNKLGLNDSQFYDAIQTFTGAAKRLELVSKTNEFSFYKDFAHSPSKLKATTQAVKKQFEKREILACMELHTFSSLNETFLAEYNGAMNDADEAIVYFNPHTIAHKKLKPITEEQVLNYFNREDLRIFTNSNDLVIYLKSKSLKNHVLLMMSSGNFDGIDFKQLSTELNLK
jgi:UDP-N-acetylmuramate: L-alanyl-gamma-D-glutamyl-meso-diaminopimelate ligase